MSNRKPPKFKIGEYVLTYTWKPTKSGSRKDKLVKRKILSRMGAGGIYQYGLENGGWKKEDEIFKVKN